MIPNAFNNMIPPFAKNMNADQDGRLEDTDFRILGDLNSVNPLMGGMGMNESIMSAGRGGDADQHKGGDSSGPADEPNFGSRGGSNSEYDRDRYRFNERSGGRNFDRDRNRDRDRDRDKYHHERNHRFGSGNRSPPYRENIFERGGSGDTFQRGGSRYDSRDFGRGGRDFRGDSTGPRGRGGRDGPAGRPRDRSRDRDYYRGGRDYDDQKSSRRFERRGRSRERTPEERYGAKKSRWTAENNSGSSSSSAQESSWASVPVPPAPMMATSPLAMPVPPPAPVLTGDKSHVPVSIAPIAFEETWDDSPPPQEPSPQRRNPSPPLERDSPAQSPRKSPQQPTELHPIQTIQTIMASRSEEEERLWNEPASSEYCEFVDEQRMTTGSFIEVMAGEAPPAPNMRLQPMQEQYEMPTHPEFSVLQALAEAADEGSVGEQSEYGDDPMDVVDQHEEQEADGQPMVADEAPATADQYSPVPQMRPTSGDGRVLSEIPVADEAPSTFE